MERHDGGPSAQPAGFGGSPAEIEDLRGKGFAGAVSWLVDYDKIPDGTRPPDWATANADPALVMADQALRTAAKDDPEAKRQMQKQRGRLVFEQMADLRYWWLRRMASGPRPLQEKMTLFWHGHFATSFEKVRNPYFLWQQNETFRYYALGGFKDLLLAVATDPAMLLYLDGAQSRRGRPNENFAREVMELFTLGEGHYTEQDIREMARAYTGWGSTGSSSVMNTIPGIMTRASRRFSGRRETSPARRRWS